MNIFVGNLSYTEQEDDLRKRFEAFGEVSSVKLINDRETGRSRGFGFVEMPDDGQAATAISELDGQEIDGRTLKVSEARPRSDNRGPR